MFLLSLLCLSGLLLPAPALADSPTFHGDYQRTGRSPDAGPVSPGLLWDFQAGGSIAASPVVAPDGTVYLASTSGKLYALAPDGNRKWEFQAAESLYATPSLDASGRVYFGDLDGWFYSLSADGSLRWKYRLTEGTDRRILSSAAVTPEGNSFVTSWNNRIYAFSPTGTLLRQGSLNGLPTSSPALDTAGNLYVACLDSANPTFMAVYKYGPVSFSPLWTRSEPLGTDSGRVISSPALDPVRNRLYIGACKESEGLLLALDLTDGKLVFRKTFPKGVLASPAIRDDGTVLVACLDGKLYALDPQAGAQRWVFQTNGPYLFGSPAVDRLGNTYIGDSDGNLCAVSRQGQRLWQFTAQASIDSAPTVHEGRLYLTSFDSRLYAVAANDSRTLYFPQVADGQSDAARMRTEIRFTNTGEDTTVQAEFFRSDGKPMTLDLSATGTVPSLSAALKKGSSLSWETSGTGPLQLGYMRVTAGPGVGAAAVLKYVRDDVTMYETGVPATTPSKELSLFIDAAGKRAMGLALVNAASQDADLIVRLYDATYRLVATKTAQDILQLAKFPKGGHLARFAFEIFPEILSLGLTTGLVTVESDQPLAATALCQNEDYRPDAQEKVTTLSVFPVIQGRPETSSPSSEPAILHLPQFADGAAFDLSVQSVLYLTALGEDSPAKIEFFSNTDGQPVAFELQGLGQATAFHFTVKKGRTLRFETSGTGPARSAHAKITTQSGVKANLVYSYRYKGSLIFEATVPTSPGMNQSTMFLDSRPGLSTALVLVNVGQEPADVRLSFYNRNHGLVADLPIGGSIPPGSGLAKYVSELVPASAGTLDGGTVTLVATQPIAAVTLREIVKGLNFLGYRLSVMPVIPGAAEP